MRSSGLFVLDHSRRFWKWCFLVEQIKQTLFVKPASPLHTKTQHRHWISCCALQSPWSLHPCTQSPTISPPGSSGSIFSPNQRALCSAMIAPQVGNQESPSMSSVQLSHLRRRDWPPAASGHRLTCRAPHCHKGHGAHRSSPDAKFGWAKRLYPEDIQSRGWWWFRLNEGSIIYTVQTLRTFIEGFQYTDWQL